MSELSTRNDSVRSNAARHLAPNVADNILDQRWARRNGTRMRAQIQGMSGPLSCTILDTSSTGAKIELDPVRGGQLSRDTVPNRFTLFMPIDRVLVDCEVAWRKGALIGVRYTAPARRAPKPPPRKIEPPRKPGVSLLAKIINPL